MIKYIQIIFSSCAIFISALILHECFALNKYLDKIDHLEKFELQKKAQSIINFVNDDYIIESAMVAETINNIQNDKINESIVPLPVERPNKSISKKRKQFLQKQQERKKQQNKKNNFSTSVDIYSGLATQTANLTFHHLPTIYYPELDSYTFKSKYLVAGVNVNFYYNLYRDIIKPFIGFNIQGRLPLMNQFITTYKDSYSTINPKTHKMEDNEQATEKSMFQEYGRFTANLGTNIKFNKNFRIEPYGTVGLGIGKEFYNLSPSIAQYFEMRLFTIGSIYGAGCNVIIHDHLLLGVDYSRARYSTIKVNEILFKLGFRF